MCTHKQSKQQDVMNTNENKGQNERRHCENDTTPWLPWGGVWQNLALGREAPRKQEEGETAGGWGGVRSGGLVPASGRGCGRLTTGSELFVE